VGIKLIRSSPYYDQANGQAKVSNQSLIEGPEKETIVGGVAWESIKIPLRNLAYILNSKPQSNFLQEGDENTNQ
jgi:hypothetical protein